MKTPIPPEGVNLREAVQADYLEIAGMVRAALEKRICTDPDKGCWVDMDALYPDNAVIQRDGKHFSYAYTIDAQNNVLLGDPIEVIETYVKAREAVACGTGVFVEAVDGQDSGKWLIRVIKAGLSRNGTFYGDAVLREAVSLFDGARVFIKSDIEHVKGGGKDVRGLVGGLGQTRFVEGAMPDTGEIQAVLTMIEADGDVAVKLREASARGLGGLFGFSIDADGKGKRETRGGKPVRVATAITKVNSVDLIVEPSAGGELIRMVEAFNPQEDNEMSLRTTMLEEIKAKNPAAHAKLGDSASDDEITAAYREAFAGKAPPVDVGAGSGDVAEQIRMVEARADMRASIAASNLPQPAKVRLLADFAGRERFVEADVTAAIAGEREYLAKFTESGHVSMGAAHDIRVEDRSIKMGDMLDAFFDPKHKDHRAVGSFREAYIEFTGDRMITGQLSHCDRTKLRESVGFREALDSTSWADALGDSITRRMQAIYEGQTDLQAWRRVATVGRVNDFRTQERFRVGGYGNLPAVAQGDPYVALTSPGDDKATYAATKRGGLETVTREMILADDVNAIRRIPTELALAAGNTLYEFVFDFFRTNPTIYDTKALYHVDHGNLFTAALDAAAFSAHRLAMIKQTRAGSAKRLGTTPAYVLVPFDLEEVAYNLFVRNTNLDPSFVQSLKPQVIPVAYWSDTSDWCTVADPMKLPVLEISFVNGQEQPELFVQDMPNVGSMFSNDKLTYKIRHEYGAGVLVDGEKGTTKAVVV